MIITIFKSIHEPVKGIGIYWVLYYYSYLTIYVCVCIHATIYRRLMHAIRDPPIQLKSWLCAIYVYAYIISRRIR